MSVRQLDPYPTNYLFPSSRNPLILLTNRFVGVVFNGSDTKTLAKRVKGGTSQKSLKVYFNAYNLLSSFIQRPRLLMLP